MGVGKANDSLFFALRPDRAATAAIVARREALRAAHGLARKPIDAARLHVTLQHVGSFGEIPREIVARSAEAAARVRAAPFEVTLDHAKSFPRKSDNRPFVLGSTAPSPALKAFQRDLGAALVDAGLRIERRRFTPHLTLLYDARQVREEPVPAITWTASEFVLLYSFYGQSRHEVLDRWPLGA